MPQLKDHVYCTTDHNNGGSHRHAVEIAVPVDHVYRSHSTRVTTRNGDTGYGVRFRRRDGDNKIVGVICEVWVAARSLFGGRNWIGVELTVQFDTPVASVTSTVGDLEEVDGVLPPADATLSYSGGTVAGDS